MHSARLIAISLFVAAGCKEAASDHAATETATSGARARAAKPAARAGDVVYAASTVVRVVDIDEERVAAGVELAENVTSIVFAPDGSRAYAATSGGVFHIDAKTHESLGQLTWHPARRVIIDSSGSKLFVLEHDVIVHGDGTREVLPFRMVTLALPAGNVLSEEEIDQRILFAHPASGDQPYHVVAAESGVVTVGTAKMSDGEPINIRAMVGDAPYRVRGEVSTVAGGHAYVPVESERSRILDIDLARGGSVRSIDLDRALAIRGLAVSADGAVLYVNAVKELLIVDLATKSVRAAVELPGAHTGLALSSDGMAAYLAQTIHGTGGAVTMVNLEALEVTTKIHLDDISPWSIAVAPRAR